MMFTETSPSNQSDISPLASLSLDSPNLQSYLSGFAASPIHHCSTHHLFLAKSHTDSLCLDSNPLYPTLEKDLSLLTMHRHIFHPRLSDPATDFPPSTPLSPVTSALTFAHTNSSDISSPRITPPDQPPSPFSSLHPSQLSLHSLSPPTNFYQPESCPSQHQNFMTVFGLVTPVSSVVLPASSDTTTPSTDSNQTQCSYTADLSSTIPPTPSLPNGDPYHISTSTSSVQSTCSQDPEPSDITTWSPDSRLTKLPEDPWEESTPTPWPSTYNTLSTLDRTSFSQPSSPTPSHLEPYRSPSYDLELTQSGFCEDFETCVLRHRKAVRSGETPLENITSRIGSSIPSLTKRLQRKVSAHNGKISRPSCTRSSSFANSEKSVHDFCKHFPNISKRFISLASSKSQTLPNIVSATPITENTEYINRESMASTPLLPPLMVSTRSVPNISSLSPGESAMTGSVTDIRLSDAKTSLEHQQQPVTRQKPARLERSQTEHRVPNYSDLALTENEPDEWSMKLGHANFTIEPKPYLPEICDAAACQKLREDWERAQCNFTKHQVRTADHFGATSTIYKLAEMKWASINAQWRAFFQLAQLKAHGTIQPDSSLLTDSVLGKKIHQPPAIHFMPSLSDVRSGGKFPTRGDDDIVGPMVQIACKFPKNRSRRASIVGLWHNILVRSKANRGVLEAFQR